MALEPGEIFGPFRIEEVIKQGGMGVVYRAFHLELERMCAVKVIREEFVDDETFRARFDREARMLMALEHENIVPIYETDEVDGVPYIATKFVTGGDLRHFLDRDLDMATTLSLLEQACAGLQAAHELKIVHRDVKPGNLLVERRAKGLHLYLCDFGVAIGRDFATRHTAPGGEVGTPEFMSPECQRGGPTDHRADIYSLGCCLHALMGPKNSSGPVKTVITRATSLYPSDRHGSADEFYRDVAAALDRTGTTVFVGRERDGLADTRIDTPAPARLGARQGGRAAVVDRVLADLGFGGTVERSCLARSRSDPRLVTAVIASPQVRDLVPLSGDVSFALAGEIGVERVRVLCLPAPLGLEETVAAYLQALFAEQALPRDFSSLSARVREATLELELSLRLDRLCDEDALAPLVALLGNVQRVRLSPQASPAGAA